MTSLEKAQELLQGYEIQGGNGIAELILAIAQALDDKRNEAIEESGLALVTRMSEDMPFPPFVVEIIALLSELKTKPLVGNDPPPEDPPVEDPPGENEPPLPSEVDPPTESLIAPEVASAKD